MDAFVALSYNFSHYWKLVTHLLQLLGSKRQHEIHTKKQSKIGRSNVVDKVRHQDGSKRANNFQPREVTSSSQATQKEKASSRASRYTRGRHNSAEFDRYQVPVYPLHNYPTVHTKQE